MRVAHREAILHGKTLITVKVLNSYNLLYIG